MKRISTLIAMLGLFLAFGASAQSLWQMSTNGGTRPSTNSDLRAEAGICTFGYDDLSVTEPNSIGLGKNGAADTYVLVGIVVKGKDFPAGKITGMEFFINAQCKTTKPLRAFVVDKATKQEVVGKVGVAPILTTINTIDFDTPVDLDPAKEYVVGYAIENPNGDYPVEFDSNTEGSVAEGSQVLINKGSSNPATYGFSDLAAQAFGNLRLHVRIAGGDAYKTAANIISLIVPATVEVGKSFDGTIKVANRAAETINALEVEVKVADKTFSKVLSGLDIKAGAVGTAKLEGLVMDAAGNVKVSVAIQKINDKANLLANQSRERIVKVAATGSFMALSSVLVERFTGEKCGNCPRYKTTEDSFIEEIRAKGLRVSRIEHHAGYGDDFLTLPNSNSLLPLYGPEGTYAPALMLNRASKEAKKTPVFLNVPDFLPTLNATQAVGAFMTIDHIAQTLEGDKYTCTVTGTVLAPYAGNEYHINVVLTESEIPARNQMGASSAWKHHDVPRLFMCGDGEKITFADNKFTFVKEGTINSSWVKENMKCVVYVGEPLRKTDISNCMLYASRTEFFNAPESTQNVAAEEIDVRVQAGGILVYGNNYGVQVYNALGQMVPTNDLASGIYLVRVQVGIDQFVVRKVIVP